MARSRLVLGVGRHVPCILGLLALACKNAHAILPLGQITYDGRQAYCAPAGFGPDLPSTSHAVNLALVEPIGITDGCEPKVAPQSGPFALFVSRGNCSFVNKALAAQAVGASAVIVHNSLEGTYVNKTIVEDKFDYECSNGNGWLSTVADPLWSPANAVPACTSSERCASGRCVVTNNTDVQKGREVCCAWDLYITMGGDPAVTQALNIPTVFVTMRDRDTLKDAMAEGGGTLNVKIAERPRPHINVSSFLIWALGVFVVIIAAWKSSLSSAGGPPKTRDAQMRDRVEDEEEEPPAVDLSVAHTVGFICTASAFLILLFYVDLNAVISVLYCISAGSAVSTIIARPFIKRMMPRRTASAPLINIHRWDIYVSWLDALSTFAGLGLAVWWYLVRHKASYAWVLQDIMGACLCILFLSLVRFPNIKVATVLLSLAFFYDIFFVFLSPLIFQESVMIKVATGGAPKADPTYCEKYPSDRDCKTREELPMLLVLPRINDFEGGNTMLGLGDIILPGLLVAFAARYDRATNTPLSRGYFRIMCLGYAVGLMMANAAVYLMEMGQPALLYLVPCTLGVFAAVAYREGTLKSFWDGPAVLTGGNSGPGGSPKPPSPVAAVVVAPSSMASGGQPGLGGHRGAPDLVAGTAVGQSGPEEEPLLDL